MNDVGRGLERAAFAITTIMFAAPASAHLTSTGVGPFYDGIIHFLQSPDDLVPALGLSLLAGLRGAEYSRWVVILLPCMWLLGSLTGLSAGVAHVPAVLSALWFILVGGLVLTDARVSLWQTIVLTGMLGVYHGYLNGAGMGGSWSAAVAVVGLACAVFVLVALGAAFTVALRPPWTRIAVRVVGSWIAASGLLLLGWAIRSA